MKTIQKGEDLRRVKDAEADSLVKFNGWKYVAKSLYKTKNSEPPQESAEVKETPQKKGRKKKETV